MHHLLFYYDACSCHTFTPKYHQKAHITWLHSSGVAIIDDDSSGITMELELQWDGNPNIVLDVRTMLGVALPIRVIWLFHMLYLHRDKHVWLLRWIRLCNGLLNKGPVGREIFLNCELTIEETDKGRDASVVPCHILDPFLGAKLGLIMSTNQSYIQRVEIILYTNDHNLTSYLGMQ